MKQRFPIQDAEAVAEGIANILRPGVERIEIAGSIRRQRPTVGDIELLYIPKLIPESDLFGAKIRDVNMADFIIGLMEDDGILKRRLNALGSEVFGPLNKLMVHVRSGIPVDLFSTTQDCWINALVCRTGGAENNRRIAMSAQQVGLKWNPYGPGFTRKSDGSIHVVQSEREVFQRAGLSYLEPKDRP